MGRVDHCVMLQSASGTHDDDMLFGLPYKMILTSMWCIYHIHTSIISPKLTKHFFFNTDVYDDENNSSEQISFAKYFLSIFMETNNYSKSVIKGLNIYISFL